MAAKLPAADLFGALTVKTSHYLIQGVALVTALSFNGLVRETIDKVWTRPKDSLAASAIYSFIMVLLLILFIYIMPSTTTELPDKVKEKLSNEAPKKFVNSESQTLANPTDWIPPYMSNNPPSIYDPRYPMVRLIDNADGPVGIY